MHVVKRPKLSKIIRWQPILSDEYSCDEFQLEPFIIADIKDAKEISKAIRALQETYPLSSSLKYKRIRGNKAPELNSVLISEKRSYKGISDELTSTLSSIREVELPTNKIHTRKQFDIVSKKYWPLQFHIDKRLESLLDSSFEKEEENLMLRSDFYSRLATDLAIFHHSSSAAIIVDPKKDRIVGSGNK